MTTDIDKAFGEHLTCVEAFQVKYACQLGRLIDAAMSCAEQRGRMFFFGNGGSALDCSHIVNELVLKYSSWRPPIAAYSLVDNVGIVSASANDGYFDLYLARQLMALGASGDMAVGLSTSGISANFVTALEKARELNMITVAFVGPSIPKSLAACDYVFSVESNDPGRIQEIHMMALHIFSAGLEAALIP